MRGVCILQGDVSGTIQFIQDKPSMPMTITGVLYNLPEGNHGFHVHEFGDTSNGCTSAGEHFNPHQNQHGGQHDSNRHLGDLGNVHSTGSRVTNVKIVDNMLSLYGEHSVLGRSLVVHMIWVVAITKTAK
uniref:Superoxide dismutase n=1 Tax=Phthorimaea operculella granulovirus TaxID=192584 RepID=A0A481SDE2_9BBAC|nr:superoxide dismutase [Phthorimaea operculella granulovirus]QBH66019.1 superoxide dismutase [Phthorimaea operculella granulovirus]QBH66149.1 superoxide dismutase [Phthorimaea operculella granulovirus]QBH66279.1 superoxide dismutase [Phthorimaea operculella granulovirus]QBH66409.1 superoxide dismutase [Phthorimaea operculella granulovirus]